MESRKLTAEEIQQFEADLDITHFNAHVIGEKLKDKIEEVIKKLNESDTEASKEYTEIYRKISVYFASYKRDKEKALLYLGKVQKITEPNSAANTTALSFEGYAYTIDPTFAKEEIFKKNLEKLPKNEDILVAFNKQYLALMHHRQALKRDDELKGKAINNEENYFGLRKDTPGLIDDAIRINRELALKNPEFKIALAESLHLKGAMLIRLGDVGKKDAHAEAAKLFAEAYQLEQEFCEKTGAKHFLLGITLQSHANVLAKLGEYDQALEKLSSALDIQKDLYKTELHADIPKTWHFKGDAASQKGDYIAAIDNYLYALILKKQIKYRDTYMVDVTQKALVSTLAKISDDKILFSQYEKIHKALDGDIKSKFENKDETFTKIMFAKMQEYRDKVSMQSMKNLSLQANNQKSVAPAEKQHLQFNPFRP